MTSRAPPLCSFFLLRVDRRSSHHFCCLATRLHDTPSTVSVATPIKLFKDLPYVSSKALFLGWLSLHRMLPSSISALGYPSDDSALRRILLFTVPNLTALTQQTRALQTGVADRAREALGWENSPF